MFYVFDLDGTLADATHRLHFIQKTPKDWSGFKAAQWDDTPIVSIIQLAISLIVDGHDIEIWTSRSENTRDQTLEWLAKHGLPIPSYKLRMRKTGDYREDFVVKAEWLVEGKYPDLVFEDRQQMVDMWRWKGIRVAQVADGNY